jgi:hypothetical protein
MEQEVANHLAQQFDILVVDALSGGAIAVYLLSHVTRRFVPRKSVRHLARDPLSTVGVAVAKNGTSCLRA